MLSSEDHSVAIVVSDHWLDEFCEHVGSLCAVLQALTRIQGNDRPHTLVTEALDNCATLQDLLNHIPVWGGRVCPPPSGNDRSGAFEPVQREPQSFDGPQGDSFPEFATDEELSLPAIDAAGLEECCGPEIERMIRLVRNFRERAEGDVRQLELLSIGREWTRLSRLAGLLKSSAAQVSAARVVVDAAALEGAARVGCRNDVELALDALKSDLHACSQQVETWLSAGAIG
jgi:hypothetical protein